MDRIALWSIKDGDELREVLDRGDQVHCSNDGGVVHLLKGKDRYYGEVWRWGTRTGGVSFAHKNELSAVAWLLKMNNATGGSEWPWED